MCIPDPYMPSPDKHQWLVSQTQTYTSDVYLRLPQWLLSKTPHSPVMCIPDPHIHQWLASKTPTIHQWCVSQTLTYMYSQGSHVHKWLVAKFPMHTSDVYHRPQNTSMSWKPDPHIHQWLVSQTPPWYVAQRSHTPVMCRPDPKRTPVLSPDPHIH
jgi:hypothetical protein